MRTLQHQQRCLTRGFHSIPSPLWGDVQSYTIRRVWVQRWATARHHHFVSPTSAVVGIGIGSRSSGGHLCTPRSNSRHSVETWGIEPQSRTGPFGSYCPVDANYIPMCFTLYHSAQRLSSDYSASSARSSSRSRFSNSSIETASIGSSSFCSGGRSPNSISSASILSNPTIQSKRSL